MSVEPELIEFLEFGRKMYDITDKKVNIMMGSVLAIWHTYRIHATENPYGAALPSQDELSAAAEHTSFDCLVIDKSDSSVFINDAAASLDVGALAKGYAADKILAYLHENGVSNYALNMGGMVSTIGDAGGRAWNVGITDPEDTSRLALSINMSDMSLVTSGVYQRYFEVEGKKYHHIINPDTMFPSDLYLSVSVLCESAALGDALSTALFNMSPQEGKEMLSGQKSLSAMWILSDGTEQYYGDFDKYIK